MIPDGSMQNIRLGNFHQRNKKVFSVCLSEHTVSKPGRRRQHGHAERDSKSIHVLLWKPEFWAKWEHNLSE